MSELTLYTTEGGHSQIKLRAAQQTVWLIKLEITEPFEETKYNFSLYLKSLFQNGALKALGNKLK